MGQVLEEVCPYDLIRSAYLYAHGVALARQRLLCLASAS